MIVKPSILARKLLGLDANAFPQLAVQRFGAQPDLDKTWAQFEPVACTLVDSFYMTLDVRDLDELADQLDTVTPELRGIAYEGAGMGLMMRDTLAPRAWRLDAFLNDRGSDYRGLIYIGAGLVLPRLPVHPLRFVNRQDPLLRWLVMDGYGFFDAFFNWTAAIAARQVPAVVTGYARNGYDQGVGRSLWFCTGANVVRIIDTIATFPLHRRADLWSGIGLACAYAAGVMERSAIEELLAAAGAHRVHMATGAAIAAVFRRQSKMPAPHTDLAVDVTWSRTADQVADLALDVLQDAVYTGNPYAQWRSCIASAWQAEHELDEAVRGAAHAVRRAE